MSRQVVKADEYVLFSNPYSVRQQYSDGQINGLKTDKLGQLLNVPIVQSRDSALFEWAFGARADAIGNLPSTEHATFCLLFKANRGFTKNEDGTIVLEGAGASMLTYRLPRLFSGVRGNGNYEPLMAGLYRETRPHTLLQQLTDTLPGSFSTLSQQFTPEDQQRLGERNRLRPISGLITPLPPLFRRPIAPAVPSPKAVHLCGFGGSVSAFFESIGDQAKAFRLLDQFPASNADEHARQSLFAALQLCGGPPEAFTLVSLVHPRIQPPWTISYAAAEIKYNIAFTSPTLLSLGKGDIVFISSSFKDTLNSIRPTRPAVFDLAVYYVTQWLENRGVTVIFSAGGSGNQSTDLTVLLRETESSISGVDPLPGIVVGGLTPDKQEITSNYGTQVTCYLPPLPIQPAFGQSSSATAQVAGGLMKLQRYTQRLKGRWLTPAEIRSLLASSPNRRCRTPQNTTVSVSVPDWASLEAAIARL